MQRSIFDPDLTWTNILYLLVAGFLGWFAKEGYKLAQLWVQRRKTPAEIHETVARARKTEAEARSIDVAVSVTAANSVMTMIERMMATQDVLDGLRTEGDQKDIEIGLMLVQIKRLKGLLDAHGIKYSEVDEHLLLKDDNSQ